jgi:hypothetical protein
MWRNPFLELDDLEAALALLLAGWRGVGLARGLRRLLDFAWFHDGTSFRTQSGLRYHGAARPGAQTER